MKIDLETPQSHTPVSLLFAKIEALEGRLAAIESRMGSESHTTIDYEQLARQYPDELIVAGRRNASLALGVTLHTVPVQPVDTVTTGSVKTHRYRVGDLRKWHAGTRMSPWAGRY